MVVKLITYATHSYGTFEDLVNNDLNIEVKVFGWGTKWNGFMDKFKVPREYFNTLNDDDIVIFVDGFDSKIIKSLDIAEKRFKSMNCRILISEVPYIQRSGMFKYFSCKMHFHEKLSELFSSDNIDHIANTGLYMGYVKDLKFLFDQIIQKM